MFGPRIQQYARRIAELAIWPLAAIGMTPNTATLLGLLLNIITAAVIATGSLRLGGVLLLFAGTFDLVDGALARVRNQKTTFGAFFDSTLDRYSEGIVLLGVVMYALMPAAAAQRMWLIPLTYVAAISSLMVSYTRARAEGLGLDGKSGLMARPERVILLAIGLLLGDPKLLVWAVGILAVTSTLTSVQRIVAVWRKLMHGQPASGQMTTHKSSAGHPPAPSTMTNGHANTVKPMRPDVSLHGSPTGAARRRS